jgi:hypothetical protein
VALRPITIRNFCTLHVSFPVALYQSLLWALFITLRRVLPGAGYGLPPQILSSDGSIFPTPIAGTHRQPGAGPHSPHTGYNIFIAVMLKQWQSGKQNK